jgi:DNA repair protein RecO (recombination protein O)
MDVAMNFKYNGVILNKFDVGETDRLYTVYTLEAGKIRVKAIGVKKPNAKLAGNLEPLTQSEIFLARGRGRGNITGAITLNNFLTIKSNISAIQKVFYVFGIFNRLITEEEKDERIFELLLDYLEAMDRLAGENNDYKLDIITLGFLFKLLLNLGYGIEVEKCLKCGLKLEPSINYFNAELGGVICSKCNNNLSKKIKISPDAIKLVRIFLKNKLENLGKVEAGKEVVNNLKIIIQEEINWIK